MFVLVFGHQLHQIFEIFLKMWHFMFFLVSILVFHHFSIESKHRCPPHSASNQAKPMPWASWTSVRRAGRAKWPRRPRPCAQRGAGKKRRKRGGSWGELGDGWVGWVGGWFCLIGVHQCFFCFFRYERFFFILHRFFLCWCHISIRFRGNLWLSW